MSDIKRHEESIGRYIAEDQDRRDKKAKLYDRLAGRVVKHSTYWIRGVIKGGVANFAMHSAQVVVMWNTGAKTYEFPSSLEPAGLPEWTWREFWEEVKKEGSN